MSTPQAALDARRCWSAAPVIVTLSMGIRHGFGLWLQPITADRGWSRETFAFALAVQNLAWGLAGPLAGGLADRWGAFRVLAVGSLLYAARPGRDGAGDDRRGLPRRRRPADRHGAGGNDLRGRLRRHRPQRRRREAQLGDGHHRRGRIVRPVPDGAGRGRADQRHRLAERALRARAAPRSSSCRSRSGCASRSAPSRAGAAAEHRRRAARGVRRPQLPAADGRLLRVRLPARLHRRAHAELPEGPRPDAAAWRPPRWR